MKKTFFLLIAILLIFASCRQPATQNFNGMAIGTYYSITYIGEQNPQLKTDVDSILNIISNTFSIFDSTSLISRVNQNKDVILTDDFVTVLQKSLQISMLTEGAFDATICPLINLWGFGKEQPTLTPDSSQIDSVKRFVGYKKIQLKNNHIYKEDARVQLDFNAIAKGFAVDKVAEHLQQNGYENYIVDIGGEVRCQGKKSVQLPWTVGIQVPTETRDGLIESSYTFNLDNQSIATSGNYRNYKEEGNVRYSHIINPISGVPEKSSLLSVSVIADDCITADAFATAFMVLGIEKSERILQKNPQLAAHFIYYADGQYQYKQTDNFPKELK